VTVGGLVTISVYNQHQGQISLPFSEISKSSTGLSVGG